MSVRWSNSTLKVISWCVVVLGITGLSLALVGRHPNKDAAGLLFAANAADVCFAIMMFLCYAAMRSQPALKAARFLWTFDVMVLVAGMGFFVSALVFLFRDASAPLVVAAATAAISKLLTYVWAVVAADTRPVAASPGG